VTTTAPAFTRSGPGWRLRLESLPFERLRGLAVATALTVAGAIVLAVNLTGAPLRSTGEGTVASRAWAVEHLSRLAPTPYLYDRPPLGWLQVSVWTRLTGAFDRAPTAVAAGREAMVVAFLASAALLWLLARRLGLARWSAALALVAFGLSPLAVALHRQVALENVAVPWLLAAFVLAASPGRRLGALAGSGALLGVAFLSSPEALLALPALALSLWQATSSENRRYVLAVTTAAFVAVCASWALYAAVKGQLSPGDGPSLARGVQDQLAELTRTGSVFSGGTTGHRIVADWLALDPLLPVLGLAAAILALVTLPRLAPVAVAYLVVAAAVVRPGHLTPTLAILLLPFGALLVGGAVERLWPGTDPAAARGRRRSGPAVADPADDPAARATGPGPVPARPDARRRARGTDTGWDAALPLAVGVSALALAVVAVTWAPEAGPLLADDAEAVHRQAARWVADNVVEGPILVDAALWADLSHAGVPEDRMVLHPTIDDPPPARDLALQRWNGDGAIVSTPATRAGAGADRRLGDLLDESLVVAAFGAGDTEVEVRAVDPGATDVASLRQHDPLTAQAAGAALGRNGDLTFTPEARALVVAGEVDERVMTTLVAISNLRPAEVADFPAHPAEVAAGEARRSVVLRTDDTGTSDIVRLVEGQDGPYRPSHVALGDDGWIRITWPIAALTGPVPGDGAS
jgi:hypothetical protein